MTTTIHLALTIEPGTATCEGCSFHFWATRDQDRFHSCILESPSVQGRATSDRPQWCLDAERKAKSV